MAQEQQQSRSFNLKKCVIYSADGTKNFDIKSLVGVFNYNESIMSPFISGSIVIADSGGLYNDLPIQGFEKLEIEIQDVLQKGPTKYTLYVWKVSNRIVQDKKQVYTLGLVSREALINEGVRVQTPLSGTSEAIIDKLLKNELKTDKSFYSQNSEFSMKMLPNRRRPFDIASSLRNKTVPKAEKKSTTGSTSSSSTTEELQGTAGYFFWETVRGYMFFSVDALCADVGEKAAAGNILPPWGPYRDFPANTDASDPVFSILSAQFTSELDLFTNLRQGKYSSLMVFFNPSTGQYEEYQYNMSNTYGSREGLGSQETASYTEKEMGKYPTRIMSMILDHETWQNKTDPGTPYEDSKNPSQYADWQKHFMAQSLTRFSTLKNQKAVVVIPGNAQICAGDKINLELRNKVADSEGTKKPFDEETSGVYLIEEVTHEYKQGKGAGGGLFTTTIRLMRDSYGMKDKPSTHSSDKKDSKPSTPTGTKQAGTVPGYQGAKKPWQNQYGV
jgi:hypothetical protein